MKITFFVFILYNLFVKTKTFISLQIFIYLSFILMDIFNIDSTYIKYLGIILCFVYALLNKKKHFVASMFFTLIADFFLLVLNDHYELGVMSFVVVQLIYFYYLGNYDVGYFKMFLLIRGFAAIALSVILMILDCLSLLNVLVMIYFSNLLFNTLQSYLIKNKILTIGLVLFVCCDICVGLHNINVAYSLATFLMWAFYLPSQVLIVLS